jgi:hypothetical protein
MRGVLGGEAPVGPTTGPVARRLPRRDLPLQGRSIGQPPVQVTRPPEIGPPDLAGQHGQLDLGRSLVM